MTLEAATRVLREEGDMTGVEIALVTFMRHMVVRLEVLATEQGAFSERLSRLEQKNQEGK